jgi:phospho-N-acetylmuramoyl-pentapeptide-transferase
MSQLHIIPTLAAVHSQGRCILGSQGSQLPECVEHRLAVARALLPAMVSGIAAFTIVIFVAPYFIRLARRLGWGKQVSEFLPHHVGKQGTPSMGGLLFTAPVAALTAVYNLVGHLSMLLTLVVLSLTSALGWIDDRLTTVRIGGEGIRARFKLVWLTVIATAIVAILHLPRLYSPSQQNLVWIPTWKFVDLGWIYWPLAIIAIVGMANAVNLTDGLDGLAAGTGALSFASFGAVALLSHPQFPYLGEFCFAMVGALLGFLWFNVFPARIIMGDTGSLALGATLTTVALMLDQGLILLVVGFVFVLEAASVMVQLSYFRLTHGRRVLRASPLHLHLEAIGWHENEVTQRFWIVGMLAAVAGLALAFI